MIKRLLLSILLAGSLSATAQRITQASPVGIVIGDSTYAIAAMTTQTEVKPGWKIVDYQTKSKTTRYLWGKQSRQLADSNRPHLRINVGEHQLLDFVLIRLKQKRDCRKLPKAELKDCPYRLLDLGFATVKALGEGVFDIQPNTAMEPGEYIITDITQKAINEYGDIIVYPFSVER